MTHPLIKQIVAAQEQQIKELLERIELLRSENRQLASDNATLRVERDTWRLAAHR